MEKIKHIAAGSLIRQALSLVIFLLLTRHLGATEYGHVASALALVSSVYNFSSFWIAPYIVKTGAKQFLQSGTIGDVYLNASGLSVAFTLLGLGLVYLLGNASFIEIAPNSMGVLLLLMIGTLGLYQSRLGLQATQRFREYGLLLWLDKLILLAFLGILLLEHDLSSASVLSATALSMLIVAGAGTGYFLLRFVHPRRANPLFHWSDFFHHTSPVFVSTLFLYFSSAPFIVVLASSVFGYDKAGWLSVAFILTGLLYQPINWVTPSLLPRFTVALETGNTSLLRTHISDVVLPTVVPFAIIVIMIGLAVLYTPIIPTLIGSDFNAATHTVALICATAVTEVTHLLIINLLYARHQEAYIFRATFIRGTLFILSASLFDSFYAVPIAYIFSVLISTCIELYAIRDLAAKSIFARLVILMTLATAPMLLSLSQMHKTSIIVATITLALFFILGYEQRWNYLRFSRAIPTMFVSRRTPLTAAGESRD